MTALRRSLEADAVRRGLDPRTARAMELRDLSMWLYDALKAPVDDEQSIDLSALSEAPIGRKRRGR